MNYIDLVSKGAKRLKVSGTIHRKHFPDIERSVFTSLEYYYVPGVIIVRVKPSLFCAFWRTLTLPVSIVWHGLKTFIDDFESFLGLWRPYRYGAVKEHRFGEMHWPHTQEFMKSVHW